jgi:hypothetical protein
MAAPAPAAATLTMAGLCTRRAAVAVKADVPGAEDYITAVRVVTAAVVGLAAGVAGATGGAVLAAALAAAAVTGWLYSTAWLRVSTDGDEGISPLAVATNQFMPVLAAVLLPWVIAYNVLHEPESFLALALAGVHLPLLLGGGGSAGVAGEGGKSA